MGEQSEQWLREQLQQAERALEAFKADVTDLKEKLFREKDRADDAEEKAAEFRDEVNERQAAADAAEVERDDAEERKELAETALREEKRAGLAMLRRLEFSLHGLCPICLGIVEHKTGCDLKLAIFRLDHELARSEFVHL